MAAETPGVVDATDEVQTNNDRSEQARHRRDDADVLRRIMHDPKGRAFLHRLIESCAVLEDPYRGESTHDTAYLLGRASVGKRLFVAATEASLDLYMKMLREAQEAAAKREKDLKARNDKVEGKNEAPLTPAAQYPHVDPPAGWPGHVPPKPPSP
jgi:hypothetical protein